MPTPYLLLPADADLDGPAAELVRRGWRLHDGLEPADEPWDLGPARLVAVGRVADEAGARAALLCAVRGAGLVVGMDPAPQWAVGFRADLQRLVPGDPVGPVGAVGPVGPVGAVGQVAPPASPAGPLSSDQRDLLDLLADGHSIAQAARLRYLSLRTANRRVAEAREALGVATTREAVLAYVRLRGRS